MLIKKTFYPLLGLASLIYYAGIKVRNYLYDKGIYKSFQFHFPVICIGNISVGGTGKTPHLFFFLNKMNTTNAGIISRGYKRKKKGVVMIKEGNYTAEEIGDEMKLTDMKFSSIPKVVSNNRLLGITEMQNHYPNIDTIWMDDGFQHRSLKPSLHIVLLKYNTYKSREYYLPLGNLRDHYSSLKRADIIIFTNTDKTLEINKANHISELTKKRKSQQVFFSSIRYGKYYSFSSIAENKPISLDKNTHIVAFSGLANNVAFTNHISKHHNLITFYSFADHYNYQKSDILKIISKYESIKASNKAIISTEKDCSKLLKFKDLLKNIPVYILPIQVEILFNEEARLLKRVQTHISLRKKII